MEANFSSDAMECLICTELPIKVTETECCGAIICQDCGPKLTTCPNRCITEDTQLRLSANKFVQRMISHIKVKCKFCSQEIERNAAIDHQENWELNKSKSVIINQALHPCVLYKQYEDGEWQWDGYRIIKGGCALQLKGDKTIQDKGISWYWKRCDIHFCEECIHKYSESPSKDLEKFSKDKNMHLSHCHPLSLYIGSELPEKARENWIGKYKEK